MNKIGFQPAYSLREVLSTLSGMHSMQGTNGLPRCALNGGAHPIMLMAFSAFASVLINNSNLGGSDMKMGRIGVCQQPHHIEIMARIPVWRG